MFRGWGIHRLGAIERLVHLLGRKLILPARPDDELAEAERKASLEVHAIWMMGEVRHHELNTADVRQHLVVDVLDVLDTIDTNVVDAAVSDRLPNADIEC